MENYIKIGKLVAAFGVNGSLVLKHEFRKKTSLKGQTVLFTENKKNSFFPWFIETANAKNENETIVILEGIDSREKALSLLQKEVWLPENDFKKFASKKAPLSLLGYGIFEESKELGKILEIVEQPHQLLCRIEINGKEVFIPLHQETIQKINHTKKEIQVILPDGLLSIYLD